MSPEHINPQIPHSILLQLGKVIHNWIGNLRTHLISDPIPLRDYPNSIHSNPLQLISIDILNPNFVSYATSWLICHSFSHFEQVELSSEPMGWILS